MASTIVFDFDGTVAVGNGPVLAYARAMSAYADDAFRDRATAEIEAFESGETDRFRDGYDVVGTLAEEAGIPADERQRAYLASREQLGTPGAAPVDPAPGLTDLLARIPSETHVILATNAPAAGIERALAAWGVRDRFDELIFDTGKPAGLTPIIEAALARGPVLAVGDIVENDLAPASLLGAATALVGATAATSTAAVTMRAADLTDLVDDIVAWTHSFTTSEQHSLLSER